ncbi:STAS domain-containing protein [Streptomyces avicenniae]|uniref:STAS domain-containing protein n=1 Tax=Streptomyces avicenniae TaxID=500153 RepID=UPI0006997FA9|nr:STAS domain-containing protein [Streptomyces avicenniae]
MTTPPPRAVTATSPGPFTVRLQVHGDLDRDTADELLEAVTEQLARHAGLLHLRLDFARLGDCDALGLSCLLMIQRRAAAARVRLHLDNRTPRLDQLLRTTGTLHHLTPAPPRTGERGPVRPRQQGGDRPAAD